MIKEFNTIEEIEKYYDKKTNTYIFQENGEYIDLIKLNFYLYVKSDIKCRNIIGKNITAYNINAWNINAYNITAYNINANDINTYNINALDIHVCNINAGDINARNIKAFNIKYYAVCFAYESIKCKSIEGRRPNAKHFVLDGKIEIKEVLK